MGKRVLAAIGVVAPMGGVLASGLSAAPTSADAATSSTARADRLEREAPLRALYRQAAEHHVIADAVHLQTLDDFPRWKKERALENCTPAGWKTVHPQIKALTGTYRFDYPKKPLTQHPRFVRGPRESADPVGTGGHVPDFGSGDSGGSRRTPRREAISPTITLHPRKHA